MPWGTVRRCSPGACADPRVEPVFRSLHAWTLKSRPQASQPMADCAQSENVSGCPVAPSIHGTPPPAARKNTPVGAAAELPRGVAGVRLAVAVHGSKGRPWLASLWSCPKASSSSASGIEVRIRSARNVVIILR